MRDQYFCRLQPLSVDAPYLDAMNWHVGGPDHCVNIYIYMCVYRIFFFLR